MARGGTLFSSYLVSCTIPLLSAVAGIVWASGQQGFDAWGIVGFLLFGCAWGIVNILVGLFVLSRPSPSGGWQLATVAGFVVGGLLPAAGLVFLLTQ